MTDPKRVSDNWALGDIYEQYVGRWSRKVAPEFLAWLDVEPARRWIDVGCGTGALCEAILDRCAPASVAGIEPSEGFLATAKARLGDRAELRQGSATGIPLPAASADVIVSGLVLNFVPEKEAALQEMQRVAAAGATIAAYVWDYSDRMEFMRYFWDAAVALDPDASSRAEGNRFPICRPDALAHLFRQSGLVDVETRAIDTPTVFRDFADYWNPFEGGQGPAPAYAMSLDEAARGRLRDRVRQSLPFAGDGSIQLVARAWAVRSRVA